MTVIKAIILGLIQGLCEFLPVSSSGHLLLAEKVFGITDSGYAFTVLLHLGTLIAVLIVYRKRVLRMILHPVKQWKYWVYLIIATAVTLGVKLALDDYFDAAEDGRVLGYCFLLTALILVLADMLRQKRECLRTVPDMKWYHPIIIGLMQGVAILPGVSRSGSTMAGAAVCGLDRENSAEFSFLLSIPAILGGAVLEIPKAIKEGTANIDVLACAAGVLVAAVSGYFAVRFMIRLITKHSFKWFAVYTAALGVFVILDQFVLHLINWGF